MMALRFHRVPMNMLLLLLVDRQDGGKHLLIEREHKVVLLLASRYDLLRASLT